MTAGRRHLRFATFDEVLPDVERLLRGHRTVGRWSLGQACHHLAASLRSVVDRRDAPPSDPSLRVDAERKRAVLDSGDLPEGIPLAPYASPPPPTDDREGAELLRAAIAHYRSSPDPVIEHRVFGPLNRDEWDRLQAIHCAHHLSFAVPAT